MSKIKKSHKITYALLAILLVSSLHSVMSSPSDQSIRSRVMKLTSPHGSCSGEQVRAPSGADYILTAGHCRVLEVDGQIHVKTEDGRELDRRIITEDPSADLLLLEGVPGMEGLPIAKSSMMADNVRTFTHGKGLPTYKTEGVLIIEQMLDVGIDYVSSPEEEAKCTKYPKNIIEGGMCVMRTEGCLTTAMVVPGSSGGPAVNDNGELSGVVSAGSDHFGVLVPLHVIRDFMANY